MVPSPAVYIQGQGSVPADGLNTFVQTISNFTQLRTFTGVSGMEVLVQGGSTSNDGLQGAFYWNSTSTAVDNNSTVIVPNGLTMGAWLRIGVSYGYSYQTPTTGQTIAFPAGAESLLLDPAGTLASLTVTTPVSPSDGQRMTISSSQIITAFTLTPTAPAAVRNAPTSFTAGQANSWQYVAGKSLWLRV